MPAATSQEGVRQQSWVDRYIDLLTALAFLCERLHIFKS